MKKGFLFVIILSNLIGSLDSYGQSWGWKGQQTCGNWRNESSICCTDKWNNVYIGGYATGDISPDSIGFGLFTFYNVPITNWQIIIAKYDSAGNVVWAIASSNGICATLSNMATDTSGNMYLFGTFWSDSIRFGSHLLINTRYDTSLVGVENNSCYFIIKFDQIGNIVWAKTGDRVNSVSLNQCGGIATDKTGNIYISSTFIDSEIYIGSDTLYNPQGNIIGGKTDLFVAKYDSNGNVLWAKSFGGTGNDFAAGVSISDNGNIYILGYYLSPSIVFGTTVLTYPGSGAGYPYMFLSRLDSSGNVIWAKGAIGLATPYAITTDKTNNVYVGGGLYDTSFSIGTYLFDNPHLNRSGFLVKYDTLGNINWAKVICPMSSPLDSNHIRNTIFSIAIDPCSNVWIDGQMTNDSILVDSSTILYSLPLSPHTLMTMLVGYSSMGTLLQSLALQVAMVNNYANSFVASDNAGNIYLSGTYAGKIGVIGTDTMYRNPDAPLETIFTAKYYPNLSCDTISLTLKKENVNAESAYDITLYPNPAYSECTISYSGTLYNKANVAIYDVTGRLMLTQPLTGSNTTISIAALLPGIYQCRIDADGMGVVSKKMVVMR